MTQVAVLRSADALHQPARIPRAADDVADWFEPLLADRLAQAGLSTLAAVAVRINQAGTRWWYPVRGLGATKAQRIGEWIGAQANHLGLDVRWPPSRERTRAAPPAPWTAVDENPGFSTLGELPWRSRSMTHPSPSSCTT